MIGDIENRTEGDRRGHPRLHLQGMKLGVGVRGSSSETTGAETLNSLTPTSQTRTLA